jgi:hypothetical protein
MKQWAQVVRDRNILRRVTDYQGHPMYTEERLFTYLQHFERDFAQSRARIIDATEGGAHKRGATPMPLGRAISQFCTNPIPMRPRDHPGLDWGRLEECSRSLRARAREAAEVQRISHQTLPLLSEVRDHLEDQDRVNRAIWRIDALRQQMHELGACYNLIMQLSQKSELNRFKADRHIAAAKVQGLDRQRRQVARDIDNVQAVLDAAGDFQRLIDVASENVNRFIRLRTGREAA